MKTENKGFDLTITVNNFNLSYNDVGEGSVPVIFIHGFPFDKSMWHGQMDFLKSAYRVISFDIRGFGNSIDTDSSLSIDLFAEDLIAFMDELNIEKAVVCGLSMGGYIVLNAYQRFSERFEALILADTQCIADTPEVKEKRYEAINEIEVNGTANFNEGFIKKVFYEDSFRNKKEQVEELKKVVFSNPEHVVQRGLKAIAERSESCSVLTEINIPTLIICGKEDSVTPLAQSEAMKESISGATLKVIENAGHVSNLEQKDEFNQHILDFLKAIDVVGDGAFKVD
ncbi:alpha/beta fold hydrolase [Flavobacterium sp. ARAG 55.4]|uniref:alpha/beta fold hydrolase n=1 Tax=Flavobacterium sp. ARAG 55.4 TaxID=3451357 RepID=UPI003F45F701